ncbi:H-NS family nucleoid-associated regulatory protein [Luteimonas fraxinea]|uniref:H-NS histone family protein n=1 Tax=Luteimonas fraxinea TaxID=2901869 RepID=UPI001E3D32D6|nr:H-NS histone family protein [Luteimonas fraxinea]MCD9125404.1 H-NS histone family protein [Luteimonas fraxinea]
MVVLLLGEQRVRFDLEKFSSRELDLLIATAEKRKKLLSKRRPISVVRAELTALAAAHGYTVGEIVGSQPPADPPRARSKPRKASKVAVKYRDPDDRRNTWSGRGSKPRWLAEKVRRGKSAADFLIPGLGRPTAKKSDQIGQKTVFKQGRPPPRR